MSGEAPELCRDLSQAKGGQILLVERDGRLHAETIRFVSRTRAATRGVGEGVRVYDRSSGYDLALESRALAGAEAEKAFAWFQSCESLEALLREISASVKGKYVPVRANACAVQLITDAAALLRGGCAKP